MSTAQYPEQDPETAFIEAHSMSATFSINGESISFDAYEINEQIYIDIFEFASEISGTSKEFAPRWGRIDNTIYITSDQGYTASESNVLRVVTDTRVASPVEQNVMLNENAVDISAYRIAGYIYFDMYETAAALDLLIYRDTEKDTIDFYTNRVVANRIERDKKIDPSLPMVAITYDDGPTDITPRILDILEEYDAVATFYVAGRKVNQYRDTIIRAYDMGNEIANHTWGHMSLDRGSAGSIRSQLEDANNAIEAVIGVRPTSMRPPFGRSNATVRSVSGELGLAVVFWSIDPSDYLPRSVDTLYDYVMERVTDRDIILFHDTHERSIGTTERLLQTLSEQGYQFVTVSELMYYSGITLEPGVVYKHAR